jgi:hypothetical protein
VNGIRTFPTASSCCSLYLRIQTIFYFPISKYTTTVFLNHSLEYSQQPLQLWLFKITKSIHFVILTTQNYFFSLSSPSRLLCFFIFFLYLRHLSSLLLPRFLSPTLLSFTSHHLMHTCLMPESAKAPATDSCLSVSSPIANCRISSPGE